MNNENLVVEWCGHKIPMYDQGDLTLPFDDDAIHVRQDSYDITFKVRGNDPIDVDVLIHEYRDKCKLENHMLQLIDIFQGNVKHE